MLLYLVWCTMHRLCGGRPLDSHWNVTKRTQQVVIALTNTGEQPKCPRVVFLDLAHANCQLYVNRAFQKRFETLPGHAEAVYLR